MTTKWWGLIPPQVGDVVTVRRLGVGIILELTEASSIVLIRRDADPLGRLTLVERITDSLEAPPDKPPIWVVRMHRAVSGRYR